MQYPLLKSLLSFMSGLILMSLLNATVFSQELPKKEPGKATETKQNTDTPNRGTNDFPVVIQIAPSSPLQIETNRDKAAENEKAESEWLIDKGTVAIAIFTLVLAIATIFLAVFTYSLWGETGRLVRGAEVTANRQLRAYVTVDKALITGLGDGQVPVAHIRIKNAGQTPAYKLHGIGGIAIGASWETLTPPQYGTLEMTQSSLGPGCTTDQFPTAGRQLNPGEMNSLLDGSNTIFVYADMHYIDTFGEPHVIEYRFKVGGTVGIRGNQLAICQEGNRET